MPRLAPGCYKRCVNISDLTLFRAPDLDGLLDRSLCRTLAPVPAGGVERVPRPAALLLGPRCTDWLEAAAAEPDLVCLVLVRADEAAPHDPRIDDVVTSTVTRAELAMRAQRALIRKRAPWPAAAPRADIDGVRRQGQFVALSATEARLAGAAAGTARRDRPGSRVGDRGVQGRRRDQASVARAYLSVAAETAPARRHRDSRGAPARVSGSAVVRVATRNGELGPLARLPARSDRCAQAGIVRNRHVLPCLPRLPEGPGTSGTAAPRKRRGATRHFRKYESTSAGSRAPGTSIGSGRYPWPQPPSSKPGRIV